MGQALFCAPGDTWQCPQTFLMVRTWGCCGPLVEYAATVYGQPPTIRKHPAPNAHGARGEHMGCLRNTGRSGVAPRP